MIIPAAVNYKVGMVSIRTNKIMELQSGWCQQLRLTQASCKMIGDEKQMALQNDVKTVQALMGATTFSTKDIF